MYKTNVKGVNELQNCYKAKSYLMDKTNANMLTKFETKQQMKKLSKNEKLKVN
jgi:hypothetical protein